MNVTLVMFKEDGERKDFSLGMGVTFIGRKENCGLRIPLGEISRKHAEVTVEEKSVTLRDLDSANGTYINNKRISEQQVEVVAGDHILIGPIVFTVQIDGEPRNILPQPARHELKSATHHSLSGAPVRDSKGGSTIVKNSFLEAMCLHQKHREEPVVTARSA